MRQVDAAGKNSNSKARKRKGKDGDDLDAMADEEVVLMRNRMVTAALNDIDSNRAGMPAVSKLKMLADAVEMLQK